MPPSVAPCEWPQNAMGPPSAKAAPVGELVPSNETVGTKRSRAI